ncbi:MAG: 23S rRNA (guanosine(2251)-2'-O)-methyltransferase RlmB [Candidatus Izemoplasmatales bacterium]|jgi:23S rRNA (guanosine2251-2'-O)-methyltransferase
MSLSIYGKNPIIEALKAERKIVRVVIMSGTNADLVDKIKENEIPIVFLDKQKFKETYKGVTQGIVAEVDDYKKWTLNDFLSEIDVKKDPLVLMLDEIQDPHNLGAILRSAEAGGVCAVIIPKNRSVGITPAVIKASSGAIEYVKIVEVTNLTQTVEKLKEEGFWIVGTSLDGKTSYEEIYVDRPLCIVIGNEGKGMGRLLKEHCDLVVTIPMLGKINSLNASVGAGIIIFDIQRRKRG